MYCCRFGQLVIAADENIKMNKRPHKTAQMIVTAFKDGLDEDLLQQIGDAQFNVLELMINEGIGQELGAATEQIQEVVRQLRASSNKPELGM